MAGDELLRWRSDFPILATTTYLISNSLGAMPAAAREAALEYADTWATRGVRAWEESWWEMPVEMGRLLEPVLGCENGSISFHPNVTLAQAVALSCFNFRGSRRGVVLSDLEFPSIIYLYEAQKSEGAQICTVKSRDGVTIDLDQFLAAIDEKTLLVPVSHVLFRSGYVQNVQAIVQRAHEVGAHVVLDVYQSAGTLPLDLKGLKVDFAVGGCLKWLCGGPGAAFLYVRPDLRLALQPKLTGWMAHEQSFAFEPGEIRYRSDAFRFLNGTPAIPCLYTARPGLEVIGKVGVDSIRRKSVRQVQRLIDLAEQERIPVTASRNPEERGGTVALRPPQAYEVSRELLRRDFLVDYRPGAGIRVSPHFYTADSELEAVVRAIVDILHSRAHRKHSGTSGYIS